jgi:hypothetical protein
MLQQAPIVVDVIKQPPVAKEITMGDVVLGAVGLTGVIMLLALTVGLLAGAVFIYLRRRGEAAAPPPNPGSEILRI